VTERRVLGLGYVVFVNVAAIFSLRTLTDVARLGWGALALTLAAFAVFFVPLTLAVVALSARHPEDGGVYRWTHAAFGAGHAFVCGWSYFVTNLVYFPAMLTHVAAVVPWLVWGRTDAVAQEPGYVLAVGLVGLWGLGVLPNALGARRTGQLSGAGVAGSLLGTLLLIGMAAASLADGGGSATPLSTIVPDVGGRDAVSLLALLSSFPFMFAGLELAPTMGGEVKDARRTLVKGALISGAVVTVLFVVTISAIVLGLRAEDIALADGIPAAVASLAARIGAPMIVVRLVALCLIVAAVGAVVVWMAGSAHLIKAAGVDQAMPAWFGRVHPRLGTPVAALVAQGVVASALLIASVAGSTVREAYATLRSVTQVTYFVPFLYLFASHVRLSGARTSARIWGGLGFVTTLAGLIAAVLPPAEVGNVLLFELKVIGGSALLIVLGLPLYVAARRRG
jgi:amino acid transporter